MHANVKVEALKAIGRYQPGDTFELSERDANAFEALQIARRIDAGYETREFTATSAATAGPEAKLRRIKRREYKRRDLRAEE